MRLAVAATVVLTVVSAAAVVFMAREHARAGAINVALVADRRVGEQLVADVLEGDDLTADVSGARRATIERTLRAALESQSLIGAWLVPPGDGSAIGASIDPAVLSTWPAGAMLGGRRPLVEIVAGDTRAPLGVLVEYLPVLGSDGNVRYGMILERDAAPIVTAGDAAARDVAIIMVVALVLLAGLVVMIFRAAHRRLGQQTDELIEAARRDPLTEMLNHGSVVEVLSSVLETARRDSGWIIVAILDIDGFRLLNDTHGHPAGDAALRQLAAAIRSEMPPGSVSGRFGPDEFLLVGPASCAPRIRPAIDAIMKRLQQTALPVDGPEPLPITISAGLASYPEHAAAVTELLSVATRMLVEAKGGGGNRVRVDAPDDAASTARWRNFDTLEGLVVAVDAKDHYTRMHSEDVARHALFLADRLGLDPEFCGAVSIAGMLHDVGKICVPDEILRKPAPLTAEEKEVMAQHTLLGHMIVSSLPGMEIVAAGVRHHHERWDGRGYPDGLAGEDIPRIARIVAVADMFSAMCTTRPYRKALPVAEAMARLRDAAGTQLDSALVECFLTGLAGSTGRAALDADYRGAAVPWLRQRVA